MRPQRAWRRLARFWKPDTVANVDEELQFHFEQKVAEFEALGLSNSAARARAEAEFGDVETVRNSLREIDARVAKKHARAEWWEGAAQDLRYVLRSLRKSPAFTATVVLTLALGLGANAALFSVLDKLYLQQPNGVKNVEQLRRIYRTFRGPNGPFIFDRFSQKDIETLREVAPEGMTIASYAPSRRALGSGGSEDVGTVFVEGDFFGLLGARPALGRLFSTEESRIQGLYEVAVLSHAMWQNKFGGDSAVVGKTIDVASHRYVVIGVLPEEFVGLDLDTPDIWLPRNSYGTLKDRAPDWYYKESGGSTRVVLRAPSEAANRLFAARATQWLRRNFKLPNDTPSVFVRPLVEARNPENFGTELSISTRLAGVALVILFIACANVVNLMLGRATSREREIAVRLALGVSRKRLFSQLMMESVVLALASSIAALVIAYMGATTLRSVLLPDIHWSSGAVGARVAMFTALLALGTAAITGLVTALQASRPNLVPALKTGSRDGGRRGASVRNSLIVAQAALSVVLLVGAGVFVRSLDGIQRIDTGFDVKKLVFASVGFDRELGDRRMEILQRLPELLQRIRAIPGVENAALSDGLPMYGFSMKQLTIPGRDSLPPSKGLRLSSEVSPGYFETVGRKLLRGRLFTENDKAGSEMVLVIDKNLADNFWPGEDALTKCIIVGSPRSACRRVVGVVAPSHFSDFVEDPSMRHFIPTAQQGGEARNIMIRVRENQRTVVSAAVTAILSETFGSWARPKVQSMESLVAPKMRRWRVGAIAFAGAGLLALLVAAVGIYSSIAYTISQRTQEMGVRVALGANSANIMRLVVGGGVRVVAAGLALGVLLSLALGRLVASLLYETSPRDPLVIAVSAATLLVAAIVASAIPAWRAARVDPLTAMRVE